MLISVLKSKIHRAAITAASLDYQGSLSIAEDLMQRVGLLPYERILCSNLANGQRFETYAIPAPAGSGQIQLNGATAHLGKIGDRLVIMSFIQLDPAAAAQWHPRIIVLGDGNVVISERGL
jgi:aspartate 1-decarboxylase